MLDWIMEHIYLALGAFLALSCVVIYLMNGL